MFSSVPPSPHHAANIQSSSVHDASPRCMIRLHECCINRAPQRRQPQPPSQHPRDVLASRCHAWGEVAYVCALNVSTLFRQTLHDFKLVHPYRYPVGLPFSSEVCTTSYARQPRARRPLPPPFSTINSPPDIYCSLSLSARRPPRINYKSVAQ